MSLRPCAGPSVRVDRPSVALVGRRRWSRSPSRDAAGGRAAADPWSTGRRSTRRSPTRSGRRPPVRPGQPGPRATPPAPGDARRGPPPTGRSCSPARSAGTPPRHRPARRRPAHHRTRSSPRSACAGASGCAQGDVGRHGRRPASTSAPATATHYLDPELAVRRAAPSHGPPRAHVEPCRRRTLALLAERSAVGQRSVRKAAPGLLRRAVGRRRAATVPAIGRARSSTAAATAWHAWRPSRPARSLGADRRVARRWPPGPPATARRVVGRRPRAGRGAGRPPGRRARLVERARRDRRRRPRRARLRRRPTSSASRYAGGARAAGTARPARRRSRGRPTSPSDTHGDVIERRRQLASLDRADGRGAAPGRADRRHRPQPGRPGRPGRPASSSRGRPGAAWIAARAAWSPSARPTAAPTWPPRSLRSAEPAPATGRSRSGRWPTSRSTPTPRRAPARGDLRPHRRAGRRRRVPDGRATLASIAARRRPHRARGHAPTSPGDHARDRRPAAARAPTPRLPGDRRRDPGARAGPRRPAARRARTLGRRAARTPWRQPVDARPAPTACGLATLLPDAPHRRRCRGGGPASARPLHCRSARRPRRSRPDTHRPGHPTVAERPSGARRRPGRSQPMGKEHRVAVVTMKQLLEAGVHFGHQTRRWNPKMKRFIFGERNGIYIIDLSRRCSASRPPTPSSATSSPTAARSCSSAPRSRPRTRSSPTPRSAACPTSTSAGSAACSPTSRPSAKRVEEDAGVPAHARRRRLRGHAEEGSAASSAASSRSSSATSAASATWTKLPDAVFIIDTKKEHIAVTEANKLGIPIVAVVDTNCDPDVIQYVIPGNDDAIRSGTLMCRVIADAVEEGRFIAAPPRRRRRPPPPARPTPEDEAERRRSSRPRPAARPPRPGQEREARLAAARQPPPMEPAAERAAAEARAEPTPPSRPSAAEPPPRPPRRRPRPRPPPRPTRRRGARRRGTADAHRRRPPPPRS